MAPRSHTTGTDRLADAHERLLEAVQALATGEDWRAMLDVAKRFHTYSTGSSAISERCEFLWTTVTGALRQC